MLAASEIHSINIRDVGAVATLKKRSPSPDLVRELRALRKDLEQLKFDQPDIHVSLAPEDDRNPADPSAD